MRKIISLLLVIVLLLGSTILAEGFSESGYLSETQLLSEKYCIDESQLVYSNTFDETTTAPITLHTQFRRSGKNIINNKRWYLGNETGSNTGLLSGEFSSFAYAFEFEAEEAWSTNNFVFHSDSGYPGSYSSYLGIKHNDDASALVPTLYVEGQSAGNDDFKMQFGQVYEVVLIAKGNSYTVYIWEKGEKVSKPVIEFTAPTTETGTFHFYTHKAKTYVDNIKVYDLSLLNCSLDHAALIYENDFNASGASVPMGISATVKNGELNVSGSDIASVDSLTGYDTLKEFQFFIDFTPINAENFNEKWSFGGDAYSLGINSDEIVLDCGNEKKKAFDFYAGKTYQIIVRSNKGKVSVYIWEKGTLAPNEPTIADEIEQVEGDIKYFAVQADSKWDNIKVYDLTKTEEDKTLKKLAEWNFDDPSQKLPITADSGLSYESDAMRVNSGNATLKTNGFFSKNISDFFFQFDYTPLCIEGNRDSFIFHSDKDNNTSLELAFNGKSVEVCSVKGTTKSTLAATAFDDLEANQKHTIQIIYSGGTVYVKWWRSGYDETPESYNIIATVNISAFKSGDFMLGSDKGDFLIDRIIIYRGIPDTSEFDEEQTVVEPVNMVKKLFEYKFNDPTAEIPIKMGSDATTSYSDNKLFIQTNWSEKTACSEPINDYNLKDFTLQFEYAASEKSWNMDYVLFRSQEAGINSCLYLLINGEGLANGGDNIFIYQTGNGTTKLLASTRIDEICSGLAHKIRITMQKNDINVWVWCTGEATPESPVMQAVCDNKNLRSGNIYFYGYQSFFLIDDMVLYQGIPERSLLDEKAQIETVEKKMLLDTDFSDESDILCEVEEPASTSVSDGKFFFHSGGQNMGYSNSIEAVGSVGDFSWQFTYSPMADLWNTDYFGFHSDGKVEGSALMVVVKGSGNVTDGNNIFIMQRVSGVTKILAAATVPLVNTISYTIRIICEDNEITVFYWEDGTNIPAVPTLYAEYSNKAVKKGSFYLQGFQSNYSLDDMRIYNYADGYQAETYLEALPKDVCLLQYNFNGLRGKTEFPFEMNDCLKYWQNTLKITTPAGMSVDGKNITGAYSLGDLCWKFEMRDFEAWSVNRFVIHSTDGSTNNCIYLLVLGANTKTLDDAAFGADPDHYAIRLIQVIDGKMTIIGKFDDEMKKGKAYNFMITSNNNQIEVHYGAKRTGKTEKIISAKASDDVNYGKTFISGYQTIMWLDNMSISNCPYPSNKEYQGSLNAVKR